MREKPLKRDRRTFSHLKTRIFAAVVVVLITTTVMIPGMASYLPLNKYDAVGLPILLFPIIWSALFIYCFMETSIKRLWTVLVSLTVIHLLCSYLALMS